MFLRALWRLPLLAGPPARAFSRGRCAAAHHSPVASSMEPISSSAAYSLARTAEGGDAATAAAAAPASTRVAVAQMTSVGSVDKNFETVSSLAKARMHP